MAKSTRAYLLGLFSGAAIGLFASAATSRAHAATPDTAPASPATTLTTAPAAVLVAPPAHTVKHHHGQIRRHHHIKPYHVTIKPPASASIYVAPAAAAVNLAAPPAAQAGPTDLPRIVIAAAAPVTAAPAPAITTPAPAAQSAAPAAAKPADASVNPAVTPAADITQPTQAQATPAPKSPGIGATVRGWFTNLFSGPARPIYAPVAATEASRIDSENVVRLGVPTAQELAGYKTGNATARLASSGPGSVEQQVAAQMAAAIPPGQIQPATPLGTSAQRNNGSTSTGTPDGNLTSPDLASEKNEAPAKISIIYGDHSCNVPGCTDTRGQREYWGVYAQNPFGFENYYAGLEAVMITPQKYNGEAASAWKDTGMAWATVGKQFKPGWGTVNLGGKLGEMNGAAFDFGNFMNTTEHEYILGQSASAIRGLNPSSGGKPLVGGFASAVGEFAGTKVMGIDLKANLAGYANFGVNTQTSVGFGPVFTIGNNDNIPLPGGPTLQGKGFSMSIGALADIVAIDPAVPKLNPWQAHAFIAAESPEFWGFKAKAEFDLPLTPETRHGVGGENMSEFKAGFTYTFK